MMDQVKANLLRLDKNRVSSAKSKKMKRPSLLVLLNFLLLLFGPPLIAQSSCSALSTYQQIVKEHCDKLNEKNDGKNFAGLFWATFFSKNEDEFKEQNYFLETRKLVEDEFDLDFSKTNAKPWLFLCIYDFDKTRTEIEVESATKANYPNTGLWSEEQLPKYSSYYQTNRQVADLIADEILNSRGYSQQYKVEDIDVSVSSNSHFWVFSSLIFTYFERAATKADTKTAERIKYLVACRKLAQMHSQSPIDGDLVGALQMEGEIWAVAFNLLSENAISASEAKELVETIEKLGSVNGFDTYILPNRLRLVLELLDVLKRKDCRFDELLQERYLPKQEDEVAKRLQVLIDQLDNHDDSFWEKQRTFMTRYFELLDLGWKAAKAGKYSDALKAMNELKDYRLMSSDILENDSLPIGKLVLSGMTNNKADDPPFGKRAIFLLAEVKVRRDLLILLTNLKKDYAQTKKLSTDASSYRSTVLELGMDRLCRKLEETANRLKL